MHKRTKDATRQAKGSVKEAIGMLIGNPIAQAEGAAEKLSVSPATDEPVVPAAKRPPQP